MGFEVSPEGSAAVIELSDDIIPAETTPKKLQATRPSSTAVRIAERQVTATTFPDNSEKMTITKTKVATLKIGQVPSTISHSVHPTNFYGIIKAKAGTIRTPEADNRESSSDTSFSSDADYGKIPTTRCTIGDEKIQSLSASESDNESNSDDRYLTYLLYVNVVMYF